MEKLGKAIDILGRVAFWFCTVSGTLFGVYLSDGFVRAFSHPSYLLFIPIFGGIGFAVGACAWIICKCIFWMTTPNKDTDEPSTENETNN